jgi:hypothetical protein
MKKNWENNTANQSIYDFDVSGITESNAREMQRIKAEAQANGTFMKAPNGKPTKLNERQWLQVRTEGFKKFFGDWENATNYDYLLSEGWVSELIGNEFQKDDIPLTKKVTQFYLDKYNGEVERKGLGIVILNERGVKDSMAHGIGSTKSAAFAAVPDIIKNGIIIDRQANWKGRGYDSYIIAAPIKISNKGYVGIVVVTKKASSNRFYLHEVALQKNLRNGFKTSLAGSPLGDLAKVLQNFETAKKNSSKVLDENGEPLVMYYGSGNNYLYEVFLNIKNPYSGNYNKEFENNKEAKKKGYDGAIGVGDESGIYMAFSPSQIKSAIKNNGNFDETSDDIRYQFIGEQGAVNNENPHISTKYFTPISRKQTETLVNLLKKSGLTKSVIIDEVRMREYLEKHLGKESAERFMSVWHGTGADFDQFNYQFLGTGEGAQAYGAGFYFTDKEDIAKKYAKGDNQFRKLGYDLRYFKDSGNTYYYKHGVSTNKIFFYKNSKRISRESYYNDYSTAVDKNRIPPIVLKVKIHGDKTVDELNFMRWDKPLSGGQIEIINKQMGKKSNAPLSQAFSTLSHGKRLYYGQNVYDGLKDLFGSAQAASNFLLRAGIDGIQYPTEYQSKGQHEESFNYVVFDENAITIEEKIRLMATPKGEVYGFSTPEGDVYLDPTKLNANTPIHEFGHLWCDLVEKNNPQLWTKIVELTKETPYYTDVLNNPAYANLKTDNARVNEAFAQAIGDNGERVFHNNQMGATFKEKFKNLLKDFWAWTGEKLGVRDLSPEKISTLTFNQAVMGAVADLTGGKVLDIFPVKIGGIALTSEQRTALANGETIKIVGLTNKSGYKYTSDVRWNTQENKLKYTNTRSMEEPLNKENKMQENKYRQKL